MHFVFLEKKHFTFSAVQAGWHSFPDDSEWNEVRELYVQNARAIMTFSFLTIPLWSAQLYFCVRNYRQGYYYLYDRIEQGKIRQIFHGDFGACGGAWNF